MKSSFLAFLVFASVLALTGMFGCSLNESSSSGSDVAGTATDTENTIASTSISGIVKRTDGKLAANVSVRMARVVVDSSNHPMDSVVEVRTDSTGFFAFDSALADTFQLAVIDTVAREVYYLPKVTAQSTEIEKIKLSKAALVNSKILYQAASDTEFVVGSHFVAYVPGTPFSRSVFAGDPFSFLIPAGKVHLAFCPGDPQVVAKLQESGVADSLVYRSWDMGKRTLKEGESVDVGPFLWSLSPKVSVDTLLKEQEKEQEIRSRISGTVLCRNGKPCKDVEVQVITDLYGFGFDEGDSLVFKAETTTDSMGRWYLPVPTDVPYDSFRVEYRRVVDNVVSEAGLSKYVRASQIQNLKSNDTLNIGEKTLRRASRMVSSVRVVLDSSNVEGQNNCTVNSVVIGLKGTSHFVRDVTCNLIAMSDLPDGEQELLLYTGDPKVVSTLQNLDTPIYRYVAQVDVNLPEGWTLDQQGMTYTPPVLK